MKEGAGQTRIQPLRGNAEAALRKRGKNLNGKQYKARPIVTAKIKLTGELKTLIEKLSQNTHEVWSQKRMKEGWRYGTRRDDAKKTHPDLVAYEDLTGAEKSYDRVVVTQVVKVILALGYKIKK